MDSLSGRRALVTGGGRGIGRAVALALARAGADVAVVARTADQVARVASEIEAAGRRGIGLSADVTSSSQVEEMARRAGAELGPIDVLVNCAGDAESAPFARTDLRLWERMLAANLTSVYLCTHALLPSMVERGWGRVVNVASSAGLAGAAYVSAYCAAKHGVVGFTRALALEVAPNGVTVNALCPGYVDTELTLRAADRIARATGLTPDRALAALARHNPSGRLLQPEQVAAAALLLAGPEGAATNGQALAL